jgi:hypothetical protein
MQHDRNHLTADELDAFLLNESSALATSHVATCTACAEMVARDARVVAALRALPTFEPSMLFSANVMARVTVAVPGALPVATESARSLSARRRVFAGLGLAATGLAGGFAWAATHTADAVRWSRPVMDGAGHAAWTSLQRVVGAAIEQPWFGAVRDTLATPSHALLATAGIAGAYALALVGLRRLMTEPATDGNW